MATKKNMAVVIGTIKNIYPYYAKDTNVEALVKTWLLLLQEYEDKQINRALVLCLKECTVPPTPADIIKKIEDMQQNNHITVLWGIYTKVLYQVADLQDLFRYTLTESNGKSQGQNAKDKAMNIYNALPDVLKTYVGSFGELLRLSRTVDDTALTYEKNRFLKLMPEICEQQSAKDFLTARTNAELLENSKKSEFLKLPIDK